MSSDWYCIEQARNPDYACDTCGGDIRGLKCCRHPYMRKWTMASKEPVKYTAEPNE